MRRYLVSMVVAVSVIGMAAPAMAQTEVTAGDKGSVEATFTETDGACGFDDFSDTYIATAGEDEQGRTVDLVQPSTGDSAQLRLDENRDPVIVPAGTDELYSDAAIDRDIELLVAQYAYIDAGCTQTWQSSFIFPPGYFAWLYGGLAQIADEFGPLPEEQTPPPEEEVVVTAEDPAPPPEEEVVVTAEDPAPPPEEQVVVAVTETGTGDPGLNFLVWILIAAGVAAFGWGLFWFFFRRPQRLYRFDRGDPGVFIDEDDQKEIVTGLEELPTFGPITEFVGEQVFLPPRASDIEIDVPPSHHLCDTYHDEWRRSIERLAQLEAEDDARAGTVDRQADMHKLMLEQARDSIDEYRAIYEDCLEAHPESEPAAPEPSQASHDSSEPSGGDDADTGEGEEPGDDKTDSGDEAGTGSPGILTTPSGTSKPKPDCLEGTTDVKIESEKSFRVLAGNVTIQATRKSYFGGKGISGADLLELSEGELEEIFAGIESMGAENKVAVRIPTQLLTIKCIRILICSGGHWIETDQTNRVEEFSDPETKSFRQKSQSKTRSMRLVVQKVKPEIEKLQAEQRAANAFGCG